MAVILGVTDTRWANMRKLRAPWGFGLLGFCLAGCNANCHVSLLHIGPWRVNCKSGYKPGCSSFAATLGYLYPWALKKRIQHLLACVPCLLWGSQLVSGSGDGNKSSARCSIRTNSTTRVPQQTLHRPRVPCHTGLTFVACSCRPAKERQAQIHVCTLHTHMPSSV